MRLKPALGGGGGGVRGEPECRGLKSLNRASLFEGGGGAICYSYKVMRVWGTSYYDYEVLG